MPWYHVAQAHIIISKHFDNLSVIFRGLLCGFSNTTRD